MKLTIDFDAMTAAERVQLGQQIIDAALAEANTVPEHIIKEAERRAAAIDAGEASCIPWEEVQGRLLRNR